jgi:hypothetical protein
VHTRCAVQCVHFQTGVVGEDELPRRILL